MAAGAGLRIPYFKSIMSRSYPGQQFTVPRGNNLESFRCLPPFSRIRSLSLTGKRITARELAGTVISNSVPDACLRQAERIFP